MEIFRYEGHNVYQLINGKLVVIKRKNKIKFWFRGIGFKNLKFTVSPHGQLRYWYWLIRLPFFYWERNNGGVRIGLPNFYLWAIR